MIEIKIPGYKTITIRNLAIDFNGTLGVDGKLIEGVEPLINKLSEKLDIYIVSADTFGNVREEIRHLKVETRIISEQNQAYTKQQLVRQLGAEQTVAIGNGRNDYMMLEEASLGIALVQKEGGAVRALNSADLVMTDIISALELFLNPIRLKASLRA